MASRILVSAGWAGCAALSGVVCAASWTPPPRWCDLPFKDVAAVAHAVVLARYEAGPRPVLVVEDVIKGHCERTNVWVDSEEVSRYDPRTADTFLLALGPDYRAIDTVRGMGACDAVSILPIHSGKLRSKFRGDYDGQRKALTLDEIRTELNAP
jgi:hypothetical protein